MSNTEDRNIDEKVEEIEKVVDPNAVITIAGYSFTPAKLMILAGIVSSVLGFLYGTFEVYKDYMDMKAKITEYVAPDFSEYEKRIIVLEQNMEKGVEYTRDINSNLKTDLRNTERILENVERGTKTSQREVEKEVNDIRRQLDQDMKDLKRSVDQANKEMYTELRNIRKEIDEKIKKALDNPLADK
jgi:hypothetical protein